MSGDTWEHYVDKDSRFHYDESTRLHDHGAEVWHTPGETLEQNYNQMREGEVRKRTDEVFRNVARFYYSRNGLIILGISVLLCLLTAMSLPEGLVFWNIVFFAGVWAYFELTSQSSVRSEWDEVEEEMESI